MVEEDPEKLNDIFEEYRREYKEARADDDEDQEAAKRLRAGGGLRLAEASSGSADPTQHAQMDASEIVVDGADPWDLAVAGQKGVKDVEEFGLQDYGDVEEFAWDDVNNIRILLDLVRKARAEEMPHMKGKIFKVVSVAEA